MTVRGSKIRVAIVGVGNCASSLVQGVEFYKDADDDELVPGLMHTRFGDYHVSDVEFVAAFDVDAAKVGLDLAEAIEASENNTIELNLFVDACCLISLENPTKESTNISNIDKVSYFIFNIF